MTDADKELLKDINELLSIYKGFAGVVPANVGLEIETPVIWQGLE